MMRVSLVGLALLVTMLPAVAADSTKVASPASRVMAVDTTPVVSRTMSMRTSTSQEYSDVGLAGDIAGTAPRGKPAAP